MLKLFPVQKKVTFISRQNDVPSVDIHLLSVEIREEHPDYKTVILCRRLKAGFISKLSYCFHMLRQMYHLATSQVLILDSYSIVASVLHHKKKLLIVQMWHSIGTMKKFGYSVLDTVEGSTAKLAKAMKMHANYDFIFAASENYKAHLAEGFNYPLSKIKIFPLPRVELLKDKKYADSVRIGIFNEYPELKNKENILYVPTFRKDEENDLEKALRELSDMIDYKKYNLIVKTHPLTDTKIDDTGALLDRKFNSFDMLFISDYVITDYSCIIYEAAILKKPVFLYAYDYDHYMQTRSIYLDYKKEMPGPINENAAGIIRAISEHDYDLKELENFAAKYVDLKKSHETEDIVGFIFSEKES